MYDVSNNWDDCSKDFTSHERTFSFSLVLIHMTMES